MTPTATWSLKGRYLTQVALGFAFNRDIQRGSFMAMALAVTAFAVSTLVGGLLGGY